jgi:hypothetical protein
MYGCTFTQAYMMDKIYHLHDQMWNLLLHSHHRHAFLVLHLHWGPWNTHHVASTCINHTEPSGHHPETNIICKPNINNNYKRLMHSTGSISTTAHLMMVYNTTWKMQGGIPSHKVKVSFLKIVEISLSTISGWRTARKVRCLAQGHLEIVCVLARFEPMTFWCVLAIFEPMTFWLWVQHPTITLLIPQACTLSDNWPYLITATWTVHTKVLSLFKLWPLWLSSCCVNPRGWNQRL